MGLSVRYFVVEDDRTVTRVPRARYQRWFFENEALPANRAARELRFLAGVVEMDHHRVEDPHPPVPALGARRCGWR